MSLWIDRILLVSLTVVVAALALTSIQTLTGQGAAGQPMGGLGLLAHMLASGVLVIGLPLFALIFLRHVIHRTSSRIQTVGYLATLLLGIFTIATVFLCMLPIPATGQMHDLMRIHGWAGFAMVPAIAVMLIGIRITRSTSRPHS